MSPTIYPSGFRDPSYSFATLPPELRLKVYEHLFNDARSADHFQRTEFCVHGGKFNCKQSCSAQLLATCRAIYSEAKPELYKRRETIRTNRLLCLKSALANCPSDAFDHVEKIIFSTGNSPSWSHGSPTPLIAFFGRTAALLRSCMSVRGNVFDYRSSKQCFLLIDTLTCTAMATMISWAL